MSYWIRDPSASSRFQRLPLFFFVCAAALSGCTHDTTGPSSTQPFSVVDLTPNTGTAAANNLNLTVDYTRLAFDPSKVDTRSRVRHVDGKTPFTFTLGAGEVIQGWDKGSGMKVGGVRRLVVRRRSCTARCATTRSRPTRRCSSTSRSSASSIERARDYLVGENFSHQ